MTARTGKFLPVGMRFAAVFELDANGNPKASDVVPYTGLRWEGPTAFDAPVSQARVINHPGRDSVIGTATLPSLDTPTFTLRVSDVRFDIHSLLTGIAVGTVGEAKEIAHMTDREGYEPNVALLLYNQSQDLDTGNITWHSYVIPKCRVLPAPSSMNANAAEVTYQIVPKKTTQRLWGGTLSLATDKYRKAAFFEYDSEGLPSVVAWRGNNSAVEFDFPSGEEALSTDKIAVYRNRVLVASGLTPAVDGLTFGTAPADGDMIVAWYELATDWDEASV